MRDKPPGYAAITFLFVIFFIKISFSCVKIETLRAFPFAGKNGFAVFPTG